MPTQSPWAGPSFPVARRLEKRPFKEESSEQLDEDRNVPLEAPLSAKGLGDFRVYFQTRRRFERRAF